MENEDAARKLAMTGAKEPETGKSRRKPLRLPALSGEKLFFAVRLAVGAALLAIVIFAPLSHTASVILGVAAFCACGYGIVTEAAEDVLHKDFFSENVLMSVAGIVALAIGETTEAVAVMLLSEIGEALQEAAVERSRSVVSRLLNMRPDKAKLMLSGGEMKEVPVEELRSGDVIMVVPGERIASDGVVERGESELDTSAVTGESMPRSCAAGTEVLSGCINLSDTLMVRVTTDYDNSTVSRIVKLVEDAEKKKGKTELLIARFCRIYTPVVFAAALVIGLLVPLIGGLGFGIWIHRALVLLVVSCPCAIVISVPLTYFAGIGGASKNGILFKNANAVDAAAGLTSVFFDKTGTMTTGKFSVSGVEPVRISRDELLYLAACAEASSTHPIARSIRECYGAEIEPGRILSHHEEKGKGSVVALSDGQTVAAGNIELMESLGVKGDFHDSGSTSVHVAVGETYVGRIDLSDTIKDGAADAVRQLRALGVDNIALMTGDNALAATRVGKAVGISEIYSDCLPQDKAERLEYVLNTQEKDDKLAFVGDGINDVPVLALADVGIAMGGLGSDAAIDTADIVLMTDEPVKVPEAVRASRRIRKLCAENIGFALGVKTLAMVLGVCGIATMWMAVFADVGVALLAIANSMRAFIKE